MGKQTYTITQKRFLRGRQTLTLQGDKLKVEYRRGLSLQEYHFELRGFLPEPLHARRVPLTTTIAAALTSVLGLLLVLFGLIAAASSNVGEDIRTACQMGPVLLILGGLGWIPASKGLTNVVAFEGPGGRVCPGGLSTRSFFRGPTDK